MRQLLQPLAVAGRGAAMKLTAALVFALLIAVGATGAVIALSGALFMAAREAWGPPYDWLVVGVVFLIVALAALVALRMLFVVPKPAKLATNPTGKENPSSDHAKPDDLIDLAFKVGAEIGSSKHGPALGALAVAAAFGLAALKKKD